MVVPPPSSPCAWCLPWSQGALPVGFCLGLRCGAVGRSRGSGRGAGWWKPMGGWKKRHFWLKASDITTLCPCETQFKGPTRKESRDTCVSVFPSSHNNTTHWYFPWSFVQHVDAAYTNNGCKYSTPFRFPCKAPVNGCSGNKSFNRAGLSRCKAICRERRLGKVCSSGAIIILK